MREDDEMMEAGACLVFAPNLSKYWLYCGNKVEVLSIISNWSHCYFYSITHLGGLSLKRNKDVFQLIVIMSHHIGIPKTTKGEPPPFCFIFANLWIVSCEGPARGKLRTIVTPQIYKKRRIITLLCLILPILARTRPTLAHNRPSTS